MTDPDAVAGAPPSTAPAGGPARVRVVWNPAAGSKAGISTNSISEEALRDLMTRHGLGDELIATTSEEEAIATARDAVANGYDIVVGAGGDGTVSTIAFQLLDTTTALGVLPLGSAMNIARSLEIPRDMEEAAAILAIGHIRAIDVGEANGQAFMEVGSVGLSAAMFRVADRFDKGEYSSFFSLFSTVIRFRPSRMVITLDDQVIATRALMIAVANTPFTGIGFTFAPNARLDDGLFDVRIFNHFSKWELMRHMFAIVDGRRAYSPRIQTYRSKAVRVDASRPRPVQVDARGLGSTPVEFRILPGALRVIGPAPDDIAAGG